MSDVPAILPPVWLITPSAPPASICTSPPDDSAPARSTSESVERKTILPAFAFTVPGVADTLSAPPVVVIVTPAPASTDPLTVRPSVESTKVNAPAPIATVPTEATRFAGFASVTFIPFVCAIKSPVVIASPSPASCVIAPVLERSERNWSGDPPMPLNEPMPPTVATGPTVPMLMGPVFRNVMSPLVVATTAKFPVTRLD